MGNDGESSGQLFLDDPLRQRGLNENGPIGQKLGASRSSVDLTKAFQLASCVCKPKKRC